MLSISTYLKNPELLASSVLMHHGKWIPDNVYLKWLFRLKMGYKLDLNNPTTYSEKLQWLKLYNKKPEYCQMVDKLAVKDYVASVLGPQYVIPILGVWEKPEDIEWDKLPNQFVLKTTHGGGSEGVIICKEKKTFDKEKAVLKLNSSMKQDIYYNFREWPYKNVHKRIIAETLLNDDSEYNKNGLTDYKFTCFNGVADNVMVCVDRSLGETKFYFYDKDWNLMPLNVRGKNTSPDFKLPKPSCMDEMFAIAGELSKGIPFLRVDLYCINEKPYFGEMTFYPASGFDKNLLPETEKSFGEKIILPTIINEK